MSKRSDGLLLDDIREAIGKILRYTAGMDEGEFLSREMTSDAVIRNMEVIGEAASKLSEHYVKKHADVPFPQMVAMRNRLIHGYFGVSLPILWRAVQDDLPPLKEKLQALRN